jgi:hypothetical protein
MTNTNSIPNCGIERARVTKIIPMEVVVNKCIDLASINSVIEPSYQPNYKCLRILAIAELTPAS